MCTFLIFGLSAIRRAKLCAHVLCEPTLRLGIHVHSIRSLNARPHAHTCVLAGCGRKMVSMFRLSHHMTKLQDN